MNYEKRSDEIMLDEIASFEENVDDASLVNLYSPYPL